MEIKERFNHRIGGGECMTTQLPEPNFIERDADKITQEWIALYEEKTGKKLEEAQIERLLIDVGVYRENLLRIKIQEVAKSNLLSYAPMEVLVHLAELVGVTKLEGKYSKTVMRFAINQTVNFDIPIYKDTEIETKDGKFTFKTDEDVILRAGETFITVGATCESVGADANGYESGTINNLVTPLSYDIADISNIDESHSGADEESVESLRERIRLAPESFSNAGSEGAYRFHTLSAHQDIIDVEVLSDEAGIVEIYPLTTSGNPSEELIQIISDYLSSEKVRPLTDKVEVYSPERVDFSVNAILTLYQDADLNTVQTLVNERLTAFKKEMASKLGKDIVPTQIIALLNSIYGVYKVELTSPQYQVLTKKQWANLESFNIRIGGKADE